MVKVASCMTQASKMVTCRPSDTVGEALDRLIDHHISALVVVENEKAVGIITKTDCVKAYRDSLPLDNFVGSMMSRKIITVQSSATKEAAAKIFHEHRVHHAVVLGERDEFVGLVSVWDVAIESAIENSKSWPWKRQKK